MSNGTRWTIIGILLAINVMANVALNGTWVEVGVSTVTGLGVLALVVDFFLRGRREP
ncbi:hypothetical protein [Actinomadura macra]|uniref:hypothetical protein n=1 Tax=Actinomadura macra TaxID=46164 RepID=UPI001C3F2C71|nr:hypothetical protein [Actinomadura macra]